MIMIFDYLFYCSFPLFCVFIILFCEYAFGTKAIEHDGACLPGNNLFAIIL